uniref:Uncharacterized protein n=1 Tax=Janibacter limosus TaxID=53458 RepID=A0AC61U6R2_9MICO|nr:hypothetical protein [Janibacter limosus]
MLSDYRQSRVSSVAYLAIAAGGLSVLIGLNGQLSPGHGAFMAIGAYTVAKMLQDGKESPMLVLLVAAAVVTALVGAVVAVAAARLQGPYVAGATPGAGRRGASPRGPLQGHPRRRARSAGQQPGRADGHRRRTLLLHRYRDRHLAMAGDCLRRLPGPHLPPAAQPVAVPGGAAVAGRAR